MLFFRYRRVKEKKPLVETMSVLLPMLLERLVTLMPDSSQESCLLQKLILKIFFGLVQVLMLIFLLVREKVTRSTMKAVEIVIVFPLIELTYFNIYLFLSSNCHFTLALECLLYQFVGFIYGIHCYIGFKTF